MLGDHKQLNPLVLATGGDHEIKEKNVDRSFMERAMACNCRLHPLRIQYRMPEVLCQLVSKLFYAGQLRSDLSCQMGSLRLHGSPLRWFHVPDTETEARSAVLRGGSLQLSVRSKGINATIVLAVGRHDPWDCHRTADRTWGG